MSTRSSATVTPLGRTIGGSMSKGSDGDWAATLTIDNKPHRVVYGLTEGEAADVLSEHIAREWRADDATSMARQAERVIGRLSDSVH